MAAQVTRSNPPGVRAPTGYTHAIQVTGDYRRLIISGQVGMALDGSVPVAERDRSRRRWPTCAPS